MTLEAPDCNLAVMEAPGTAAGKASTTRNESHGQSSLIGGSRLSLERGGHRLVGQTSEQEAAKAPGAFWSSERILAVSSARCGDATIWPLRARAVDENLRSCMYCCGK